VGETVEPTVAPLEELPTPEVTPDIEPLMPTTGAAGERFITVVGEGRASGAPDIAEVQVGVEVVTDTVQTAVMEARDVVSNVIQSLEDQGIAAEDMRTSSFNIFLERMPSPEGMEFGDETRYHVINQLQVTVRDTGNLSEILSAAIDAGANQIFGINFRVEDVADLEQQALEDALSAAETKAQYLAQAAGLQVGEIVSISQVVGQVPIFAEGMGGGGGVGPIQPGQLEVVRQLQVTYALQ
jgi:uncharacterized protein YggE